jgi:hypothetical protein
MKPVQLLRGDYVFLCASFVAAVALSGAAFAGSWEGKTGEGQKPCCSPDNKQCGAPFDIAMTRMMLVFAKDAAPYPLEGEWEEIGMALTNQDQLHKWPQKKPRPGSRDLPRRLGAFGNPKEIGCFWPTATYTVDDEDINEPLQARISFNSTPVSGDGVSTKFTETVVGAVSNKVYFKEGPTRIAFEYSEILISPDVGRVVDATESICATRQTCVYNNSNGWLYCFWENADTRPDCASYTAPGAVNRITAYRRRNSAQVASGK